MKITRAIYCIDTQKITFRHFAFRFLTNIFDHNIDKLRSKRCIASCTATVVRPVRRTSYNVYDDHHTHRMTAVVYSPKRHKQSGITAQIFYIYYVLTERIAPNLR